MGDQKFHRITNLKNRERAYKVESQSIESTFAEEYVENQTEEEIISPSEGNKIVVKDVSIHTKANSGEVQLDFNGKKIARLYSSVNNRFAPTVSTIKGGVDEPVKLTTATGDNKVFIIINYIEVAGD